MWGWGLRGDLWHEQISCDQQGSLCRQMHGVTNTTALGGTEYVHLVGFHRAVSPKKKEEFYWEIKRKMQPPFFCSEKASRCLLLVLKGDICVVPPAMQEMNSPAPRACCLVFEALFSFASPGSSSTFYCFLLFHFPVVWQKASANSSE